MYDSEEQSAAFAVDKSITLGNDIWK